MRDEAYGIWVIGFAAGLYGWLVCVGTAELPRERPGAEVAVVANR